MPPCIVDVLAAAILCAYMRLGSYTALCPRQSLSISQASRARMAFRSAAADGKSDVGRFEAEDTDGWRSRTRGKSLGFRRADSLRVTTTGELADRVWEANGETGCKMQVSSQCRWSRLIGARRTLAGESSDRCSRSLSLSLRLPRRDGSSLEVVLLLLGASPTNS